MHLETQMSTKASRAVLAPQAIDQKIHSEKGMEESATKAMPHASGTPDLGRKKTANSVQGQTTTQIGDTSEKFDLEIKPRLMRREKRRNGSVQSQTAQSIEEMMSSKQVGADTASSFGDVGSAFLRVATLIAVLVSIIYISSCASDKLLSRFEVEGDGECEVASVTAKVRQSQRRSRTSRVRDRLLGSSKIEVPAITEDL